jgi:hypothetical protein
MVVGIIDHIYPTDKGMLVTLLLVETPAAAPDAMYHSNVEALASVSYCIFRCRMILL